MRILIVEDEKPAAVRLQNLIVKTIPDAEILGTSEGVESTLNFLDQQGAPDLIFMDIHLADGSAFEIFRHYRFEDTSIIFCTAYDQYAIEAFKVNALYYLLKPVKKEDLEQAMDRYRQHQMKRSDYKPLIEKVAPRPPGEKRFLIRMGQSLRLVRQQDIAYFYTSDKITFLMTREGRKYPVDYTLEHLEEMVDPTRFFRINRQFILQIDAIQQMQTWTKARVKIELTPPFPDEVIVSTEKSPAFKKWLEGDQ